MKRLILLLAALATASCSPAPKDILVLLRGGRLVIDFPWSWWRVVGLQDRTWCVDEVQLYDSERLLWVLSQANSRTSSCEDIQMPIVIGRAAARFHSIGTPRLERGKAYGVTVYGMGAGQVSFTLSGSPAQPRNVTEFDLQLPNPCAGFRFEGCRRRRNPGLLVEEAPHLP